MENNEKLPMQQLGENAVENVSGGANIDRVICCTCGAEIRLTGPMMDQYYNHNICPRCKGRIKSW